MSKKMLKTWEVERGVIAIDRSKYPEDDYYSEEEFTDLLRDHSLDFVGCNHEDRIAFLKANGYEVNHANMIDSTLSHRSEEERES